EVITIDLSRIIKESISGEVVLSKDEAEKKIEKSKMFHYDKAVKDDTLCLIKKENGYTEITEDVNPYYKTIVVLLESPHKAEYTEDFAPIRPLNSNDPRVKLKKALKDIINSDNDLSDGLYRILLVNPIQFQTSMYEIFGLPVQGRTGKKIRDKVWDTLWKLDSIKDCLSDRLKKLELDLKMIIISTTKQFRPEIRTFLNDRFKHIKTKEIHHPSCRELSLIKNAKKK
ncbi:MAG TPA: hypothetical protein PLH63_08275, partial [Candidatus Cloacimonadota bacterium]|nr:hypothetical protein [Candidatus Cloacimonadota bacterium]